MSAARQTPEGANSLPEGPTPARPHYVCVAGPTASGKTAAALAVAQALPIEIVSVDSALVYRGMDIGTAKPGADELAAVPHHLIDIIEPNQTYSAAQFVADAKRLVDEIRARGRLPLLVGGTMLYFKALFDGIDALPAADAAVRAEIDAEAARMGWPALHAQLARLDPATAARLSPNDAQRIQRALEVHRVCGRPLSAFHTDRFSAPSSIGAAAPLISLEPHDRAWLHRRIAQRFEQMLAEGFIGEVRRLRARADLTAAMPSMRCVGYRQAWEMLDGLFPPEHLAERGVAATRQLAKRQLTWLRGMPHRQVVACDAPDAVEQVVARVQAAVGSA
ncbi:tRNA (adenosine(37)-N6)-dimethylallyltransferase MiaA [Schlegelella sp. S2-27]|uniref:tRNA dimethylallyltransferase n=1 Tax=Caldimonas mangrovi TaxID=2944811 RepID=A0ABT0YND2_9BURK|nr:tRNA (adenosine(37)-N6)-dimethylallyltransferase MiaA [Caldimonas mangrovi]MCM5680244.1 tRNA (adenosine(37)-N6)-dimethylallyltransferase MiaA [Caldimonas mangrovi]